MRLRELVSRIHDRTNRQVAKRDIEQVLDGLVHVIRDEITRAPILVPGLGTFGLVKREARRFKDPAGGPHRVVPARLIVRVKPDPRLAPR
jgi:nucleoid DNA-binding protein